MNKILPSLKELLTTTKELLYIVPAFCSYYLITEHLISLDVAEGSSMEPTLKDGELVLVQKGFYTINKGDVIIAKSPIRPDITVCKRVIYQENELAPNGLRIAKNHIWIEGDNAKVSFDSKFHGPIPLNLVSGKVIL